MKRAAFILAALALSIAAGAQDYRGLDSLLTRFYDVLLPASIEEKTAEFDRLILTCTDTATRQHVALQIFDHYKESPMMGEEEVAVHIYDRWFGTDEIKMTGDMEKFDAQMFADFNRSTLIGKDCPVIEMISLNGKTEVMPEKGRTSILFFYDPACAKCKLEAKLLPKVLEDVDFPINFYSVNCGSDRKAWRKYARQFKIRNRNVKVIHLWDPQMDTDYLRLFGVISTPKMYMVEPQGMVIGRRLDPESLMQLLPTAGAIQGVYNKHISNSE